MDKKLVDMLIAKAEHLGWSCEYDESDDGWEFSQYSPAGEDFFIEFFQKGDDIVRAVREYAIDFDTEEHAKMWIGGRGAPDIVTLVHDADDIQKMLDDLADGLQETLEKYEADEEEDLNAPEGPFDCCVYVTEIRYGAVHLEGVSSEEEAKELARKAYNERRIDWHSEELSDMTVDKN